MSPKHPQSIGSPEYSIAAVIDTKKKRTQRNEKKAVYLLNKKESDTAISKIIICETIHLLLRVPVENKAETNTIFFSGESILNTALPKKITPSRVRQILSMCILLTIYIFLTE